MSAHRQTAALLGPIERLFGEGTLAGLDDGQLLERFVAHRDEHAFAGLVERLGPMVAGVCRRRLVDPRDVEDAFQATFLVLVRKAGSIRDPRLVGNWLYGVAARVSSRARAQAIRRKGREGEWMDVADPGPSDDSLRAVLDEEIARLPEKYRRPLVLCYLEGLTHDEAADRLRCPVGTVRSRMAWARDRLRSRLTRVGAAVPSGLAVASEATAMSPPVPQILVEATVRFATMSAAHVAREVSAHVAGLAQGVIRAMTLTNVRSVLVFAAALVLGTGGLALSQQGGVAPVNPAPPSAVGHDDTTTLTSKAPVAPRNPQVFREPTGIAPVSPMRGIGGGRSSLSQRVLSLDKLVAFVAPAQDQISVYSEETGTWDVYRARAGTKVTPIASGSHILTWVKGGRIDQVAAISSKGGKWKTQDLATPASGELMPVLSNALAAYAVGGQVYAYSAEADRWDVLDLGPGKSASPVVGASTILVEDGDRLSVFGAKTGKWETTDIAKP
jgi:RNA polymerase sigma factor (sigma-70 family)